MLLRLVYILIKIFSVYNKEMAEEVRMKKRSNVRKEPIVARCRSVSCTTPDKTIPPILENQLQNRKPKLYNNHGHTFPEINKMNKRDIRRQSMPHNLKKTSSIRRGLKFKSLFGSTLTTTANPWDGFFMTFVSILVMFHCFIIGEFVF